MCINHKYLVTHLYRRLLLSPLLSFNPSFFLFFVSFFPALTYFYEQGCNFGVSPGIM